jgi:methylaspartate ammonia-lyase
LNHKIIIVDEEINIKPMNDYLYGLKEKYKNVTNIKIDGPTDADIKLNQINNYININDEIKQKNIVNKGIYILFFYYKESDLDNACAEIEGVGNSTKTSLTRVENKQTVCNILNTLYVPLSDK